jgi:hypothetical protein
MEEFDGYYGPTLWDSKNGLGPPTCDDWARIRFFSSSSKFFMKPQCDFRGLCM